MKSVILLCVMSLWLGVSCSSMKKPPAPDEAAAGPPTSARPEDVAAVDAFFAKGGKHGFHPPADQTPDLTAATSKFVVELDQQRVYLYHQGSLIAASRISSGRPGYRTETGEYTIGQKNLNHRSNLYGNFVSTAGRTVASDVKAGHDTQPEGVRFVGSLMKYFQRFERKGSPTALGFHQGVVPKHPASHGCIRLPSSMAAWFFANIDKGTPVQINGAKYGVKPGTRQAGGRRAPRKITPPPTTETPQPPTTDTITTSTEAEGSTAPPPPDDSPAPSAPSGSDSAAPTINENSIAPPVDSQPANSPPAETSTPPTIAPEI